MLVCNTGNSIYSVANLLVLSAQKFPPDKKVLLVPCPQFHRAELRYEL